ILQRDRAIRVRGPESDVPLERPRRRRGLEVEPGRGVRGRAEAPEVERRIRLGGEREGRSEEGRERGGGEGAEAHGGPRVDQSRLAIPREARGAPRKRGCCLPARF